jgi:hypothetical protein
MIELIKAIDAERPARPETDYDIGYNNGLRMAIVIAYKFAADKKVGRTKHWLLRYGGGVNWVECPVCRVCGSPQWKVCPVCETKMEVLPDGKS